MTLDELQALAERLAEGRRVVTAEELRLAGADPKQIKRLLGGRWQAPLTAVYVIDDLPLEDVDRARVAEKAGGEGSVISGWLAASWHGLPWIPSLATLLVLVPPDRRRVSRGFLYARRTNALTEVSTWQHLGFTVAGVAQSVIDTTRQISMLKNRSEDGKLREARGVVLGAIGAGRCSVQDLLAVLGAGAVAHSKLARLACTDAERGVVSPPEAEMADDLLGYGVPFVCNVEVWVDGVFKGISDGYLLGTGVAWEGDSVQEHAGDKLGPTLRRWEGFTVGGISQKHVTPSDYRAAPHAFWRGVFEEVRRRQALGTGDPPGLELRKARGPVLCGDNGSPPYRVDLSSCVLPTYEERPAAA